MPLDQDIINLSKAIRQVETGNRPVSGASGEMKSRYQFMPATWKAGAKKYLGNENATLSLENENKVAYSQIKDWKDKGYGPDQIASMWNSGKPEWKGVTGTNSKGVKYDVPGYVKKVGTAYGKIRGPRKQEIYQPPAVSQNRQLDIASTKQQSGFLSAPTLFTPNTENPDALTEGLKTVGNVLPSAWNFARGAILSPYRSIKNILKIPGEIGELKKGKEKVEQSRTETARMQNELIEEYKQKKSRGEDVSRLETFFKGQGIDSSKIQIPKKTKSAFGQIAGELPEAAKAVIPSAVPNFIGALSDTTLGTKLVSDKQLTETQRKFTADPFGEIFPWLAGGKFVAGKLGKTKAFDTAISKTASPVIKTAKYIKSKVSKTSKFATSQATGLQPKTISGIIKHAKLLNKERLKTDPNFTRGKIGSTVQSAITKRLNKISETGKLYGPIRQSVKTISLSKNWLLDTIKSETGLKIVKGKFKASASSRLRANSDVRAAQSLYNIYKSTFKKGKMTPNEFLNFRSDLANLAKFEREIGISKPIELATKSIRAKFNKEYRSQVAGLEKLDAKYAPQIVRLKELTKGLVDKEGNLKPTAYDTIANSVGKGFKKGELLKTLEELVPGIKKEIKIAKIVEDIQNTSGIKVGAYGRTGLVVGAGLSMGVVQAIVTAILTSPEMAVPILRQFGVLKNSVAVQQVLKALKNVNKIPENQMPAILKKDIKQIKVPAGMSIKDVSGGKPSAFALKKNIKIKSPFGKNKLQNKKNISIKELEIPEFNNGKEVSGWSDIYRKSNKKTMNKMDSDINYLLKNKKNELAPILIKKDGNFIDVIDGHHRVASYLSAGRERIPIQIKN